MRGQSSFDLGVMLGQALEQIRGQTARADRAEKRHEARFKIIESDLAELKEIAKSQAVWPLRQIILVAGWAAAVGLGTEGDKVAKAIADLIMLIK